MARAFTVLLPGETLPQRKPLQAAIDALGFRCRLDAEFDSDFSGYLACDLDGEDAGFTLRKKDETLTLSWGGDPREEAAASIFCAALAQTFGAGISRDGATLTSADLVGTARKALA